MLFKVIFISSSGGRFVQWSRTACVILVKVIMGNIPVQLF